VEALLRNTTGGDNTAVGFLALGNNTSGSGNIALGSGAGSNVTTANNVICIGTVGNNVSDSSYIGNVIDSTSSNGVAVLVNGNGTLGTMTSSARFKKDIKPMDKASEALLALKPVTFRYKKEIDPAGTPQLGLGRRCRKGES
jgi:Chaperone of endosialidase